MRLQTLTLAANDANDANGVMTALRATETASPRTCGTGASESIIIRAANANELTL